MPLLTVLACAEVVPSEKDQRVNLYPAFGVAVQVAEPPVCTLVGETVTCLKFNIYRQSANLTRTYDLVVGSVKDDTGTLRIYEGFNSDGNFRGVAPEVHTGLGRIVDVAYREMLK